MMQETQELKLPISGKLIIMRGYMTGYIDQEVQRIMVRANKTTYDVDSEQIKASQASGEDPIPTLHMEKDAAVEIDADNKRIELMVTALDGSNGDILNRVLSLPNQDVRFILNNISRVEGDSKVEGSDPKELKN